MDSVLASLFPDGPDGFLAGYPTTPCHADGPLARLPPAVQQLSFDALCAEYRGDLDLHGDDSRPVTVHPADSDAVRWLFERSAGVTFDRIERFVPGLDAWCAAVATELSLPVWSPRPRCNAFASPRSAGYRFHFHAEGALLVQLEGRKEVRLAPMPGGVPVEQTDANQRFEAMFGSEPRSLVAHAQFAATGFPEAPMAEGTLSYTLQPGSALYIPPGWWHATRADSERSFAFSTFVAMPRWYEVLLHALELALLPDPRWRAPVALGEVSAQELAERRASLAAAAAGLRLDDLRLCLGRDVPLCEAATLCPNPDARWSWPRTEQLRIRTDHEYEIDVDTSLVEPLRALLDRTAPFSLGEVVAPDVEEAVALLLSVGALVRGPFPVPDGPRGRLG